MNGLGSHEEFVDSTRDSSTDLAKSASGVWNLHWRSLGNRRSRSLFGLGSSAVRQVIFQPAVRAFLDKYFAPEGVFIETGCGTGESSSGVPKRNRRFFGLDFSPVALEQAHTTGCFDSLLCADLFQLPFLAGSVDGIWNLGVMEHFERAALFAALAEFRRALKPGGRLILFWPAELNSSRLVLAPIERMRSRITKKRFHFFPDEVSRLKSRREGAEILNEAGFDLLDFDFSWRTAFIHMVLVGQKRL